MHAAEVGILLEYFLLLFSDSSLEIGSKESTKNYVYGFKRISSDISLTIQSKIVAHNVEMIAVIGITNPSCDLFCSTGLLQSAHASSGSGGGGAGLDESSMLQRMRLVARVGRQCQVNDGVESHFDICD